VNLFLIRHGETLSNRRRIYAGKSPEPLTERGRMQAIETATTLKDMHINAIYTSPIRRAVETAEIIGDLTGKDYTIIDDLREMELGPWEGLSEEEISRLYPHEWSIWLTRPAELRLNGRETLEELLCRAINGIKKIRDCCPDGNPVIITHVALIRVLYLWSRRMNLNLYKTIDVPNAHIFEITINPDQEYLF